ncbi:THAP domain-containing protein [Phthorimaea operculella]|nr:THAP domain-containing protein [Phthorimaea operculella]
MDPIHRHPSLTGPDINKISLKIAIRQSHCSCTTSVVDQTDILMMSKPHRCCVRSCENLKFKRRRYFHSIPTETKLRRKWLQAIQRSCWIISKDSRICSRHFGRNDYTTDHYRKKICLREDAIPKYLIKKQIPFRKNYYDRDETNRPITYEQTDIKPNVKVVGDYYLIQLKPGSTNNSEEETKEYVAAQEEILLRKYFMDRRELQVRLTRLPKHVLNSMKITTKISESVAAQEKILLRKYFMDRRELQVRLTRLPKHVLNSMKITTKISASDYVKRLEALGLHTELDIELDPEVNLKEEPQDFTMDYENTVEDDSVCTSELNTKLETEGTLTEPEVKLPEMEERLPITDEVIKDIEVMLPETEVKLPETEVKLPETEVKLPETEVMLPEPEVKLPEPEVKLPEPEVKLLEIEVMLPTTDEVMKDIEVMLPEPEVKLLEIEVKLPEPEVKLLELEVMLPTTDEVMKDQLLDYNVSKDDNGSAMLKETKLIGNSEAVTDAQDTGVSRTTKDEKKDGDNLPKIDEEAHSNEKQYACKICDKKFTHDSDLYKHVKLHKTFNATNATIVKYFMNNLLNNQR